MPALIIPSGCRSVRLDRRQSRSFHFFDCDKEILRKCTWTIAVRESPGRAFVERLRLPLRTWPWFLFASRPARADPHPAVPATLSRSAEEGSNLLPRGRRWPEVRNEGHPEPQENLRSVLRLAD
jgi:hypothetical protein